MKCPNISNIDGNTDIWRTGHRTATGMYTLDHLHGYAQSVDLIAGSTEVPRTVNMRIINSAL